MRHRSIIILTLAVVLAACGTLAEPRPTFEPTHTALPRVANVDDADATSPPEVAAQASPTLSPSPLPPTATPEPTTPPTEEPTPEPTAEPTVAPTEAPAEVMHAGLTGDAEVGEIWFNGAVSVTYNNVEWQCSTCHNVAEPLPGSGPYLYGIANVAGERTDPTAIAYLYESIMNPNEHIAPPQENAGGDTITWEAGVMPDNWNTVLDEQAVVDIVAYLMTLDQSE